MEQKNFIRESEVINMKNYFKVLKRYHMILPLLTLVVITAINSSLGVYITKLFQFAANAIGTPKVTRLIGILLLTEITLCAITRFKWYLNRYVRESLADKYRTDIFSKTENISVKDLEDFSIPTLTSATQYAYTTSDNMVEVPKTIVSCLSTYISTVCAMLTTDVNLSFIMIGLSTICGFVFIGLYRKVGDYEKERTELSTKLNTCITRLEGYLVTKCFAKESYEVNKYADISGRYKKGSLKKSAAIQNASTVFGAMNVFIDAGVLIYLSLTYDGNLTSTISKALVFYSLANNLFAPFDNLLEVIDATSTMMVHINDNEKLLSLSNEYDGTIELEKFNDSIEFRNVSFSYEDTDNVLSNINTKIEKGQKVGIYGRSGSGKSTFVNLINRFFPVDSGEILIDGVNINQFTKSSLRKIIGNVTQESFLFSDMTVMENIKYGTNATNTEVVVAAKLANAHDFITKLPDGYNSYVGNNGVKLSGGEKQRVAIARLFLLNPPILILDEATSSLDTESETYIKQSIEELSKNKTVISIAHRFTTIENSDLLIGIKDHTICECGPAEEIKSTNSLYNELAGIDINAKKHGIGFMK